MISKHIFEIFYVRKDQLKVLKILAELEFNSGIQPIDEYVRGYKEALKDFKKRCV